MSCEYTYFNEKQDKLMVGVDREQMASLDLGRKFSGVKYVITSGVRTKEENALLSNAVANSAHLTGHATDLYCPDSTARFAIIDGLIKAGFKRIGIGPNFVHVDNDDTKPAEVFFVESNKKGITLKFKLGGC